MLSRRLLTSLLVAAALCDAVAPGRPEPEPVIQEPAETERGQDMIGWFKSYILKQPKPFIDKKTGHECFFERSWLEVTRRGIHIDIISDQDDHVISASRSIIADITRSWASFDSRSAGWRVDDAHMLEGSASVSASFGGVWGSSGTVTSSKTGSSGRSNETGHQDEVSHGDMHSFECPPHTKCYIETWSYAARIQGNCTTMPMLDPVCFFKDANRKASHKTAYAELEKLGMLKHNISKAAVEGMDLGWPAGNPTYELLNSVYEVMKSEIPAKARIEGGAWMPPKVHPVNFLQRSQCELTTGLFTKSGKPFTSHVMHEEPINRNASQAAVVEIG